MKPSSIYPVQIKGLLEDIDSPKEKAYVLEQLRPYVREGRYRIGSHATKHATCEGFSEQDMVEVMLRGNELLHYWQDKRLLVLGYIELSSVVRIPLHVVMEYTKPRWVDIVTAFIPAEPHQITSRSRLAELSRHDRHERKVRRVGPTRLA
ncbi:MAG: DUF4258 domain-containing protein [Trueperaceae bacterium]